MKPRRLIIEGLRSHRGRTEIDFTDVSLFAIVGDTGSGKSSILEAIVYALYAAATWTKQPGELISDGMRTMTVELTFEVDGRIWVVRRSMSRGGYPAPIHLLTAVDDPSVRFDTAASVDHQVERLLGLTVEAFCSAVILPQGRFERLLNATPADRTRILKGIFRLERLDEARDLAKALVDRYRPAFEELRRLRAALLADPVASAAEAGARLATAEVTLGTMTELLNTLDAHQTKWDELTRQEESVEAEAASLARARRAVDPTEGDRLLAVAAALDAELQPLVRAAEAANATEAAAVAAVEEARQNGLGAVSLATYRETIEGARSRLPQLADRGSRLDIERGAIEGDTAQLALDTKAVEALGIAAVAAANAAAAGQAAASVARHGLEAAQTALANWQSASTRRAEVAAIVVARSNEAVAAGTAADHIKAQLAAAVVRRDTAEADLDAAMRGEAAATAAHGHGPGDPCPICARPLPKSWQRPDAPALATARSAFDEARAAVALVEKDARDADNRTLLAEQQLSVARDQQTESERGFERTDGVMKALLPTFTPDAVHDEVLGSLQLALDEADATARSQIHASEEARTAETRAQTSVLERQVGLSRRSEALTQALGEVEADVHQVRRALSALPATLVLPPVPRAEDFEATIGNLETFEAEEASKQAALERTRLEQRRISEAKQAVDQRRRSDVDVPLSRYREGLARLAAAIERAETHVGADGQVSLDGAAQSVIEARASGVAAQLTQHSNALREQLKGLAEEQLAMLSAHNLDQRGQVAELVRMATGERAVAVADLTRAQGQIPEAAGHDQRIVEGGSLIDALAELARLLGDGQFISYVVEARQRALLGIASTILDDMSGGRYGFSEDFQIVDRISGQPRSPKTLSGGETFQASLALALSLVELAGRSGGRLSALFLDEGFGTLDANALDEALEELERRAASGRVIGVISHLRSVADRIEHVLRVDKELGRTHVRWLDGTERELMNADDLAHAGLTS